jgi:multiple sugar transport system substrate-binding protein
VPVREDGAMHAGRRQAPLRRALALLAMVTALAGLAACGGGGGDDRDRQRPAEKLTVWILENERERVRATIDNIAVLTRRTGIQVDLVGVGDDQLAGAMERAKAAGRLPDVVQLPLPSAHAYADEGILDLGAAEDVVRTLGAHTFSQTALRLVTVEGRIAAVPSDGWGQLLIYRRDVFRRAGLRAPRTVADIARAARALDRPGRAGITLATAAGAVFTAETFEHIALAMGCDLVDDLGKVALTSRACVDAFRVYTALARHSPGGVQDVDSTRDAYFAGRAAMILWSPFLLDAMAGLRDDAAPTCPECRRDPAFLARNSGLVGPLERRSGDLAQFGDIATWGITEGADVDAAVRFVEYMLSDGYLRWLALAPQGKYPMRAGDDADPERYIRGWAGLESGVDRKAPLDRFYSEASIESLGEGARNFRRWGFETGQGALVGALRGPEPVTRALAAAIDGRVSPAGAARRAQAAVERLAARIG